MGDLSRRGTIAAGLATTLVGMPVRADPASRVPRIGFLIGATFPTMAQAFEGELRRLGWIDGDNIRIETRLSRPNSADLRGHLEEFKRLNLDLVVAAALGQALAVRQAMPDIPMVVGTAPGMVANGLANSVERPGLNTTGMDELPPGLTGQRLRLLKAMAPGASRIALLSTTPGRGGHEIQLADAEAAAASLKVTVKPYRATSLAEVEAALAAMAADRMEAMVCFQGAVSLVNRDLIIAFMAAHRMPAIYQSTLFALSGGLMALSPDQDEQFRVAARNVDKILKGARAGDVPITHPARYYLTIHTGAAAGLGLEIPPALRTRADRLLP